MILIDADILSYRIGFATEDETEHKAKSQLDNAVADILVGAGKDAAPYQLYLTGKGNFRFDVATILPYKGTRSDKPKPRHYQMLRDYMVEEHNAIVVDGMEADDAIAIAGTANPDSVMVSIDKDFLQVAGHHYNFVKDKHIIVSEWEGMVFLYTQMLTGDRVDNIQGVYGIGEKKAAKILEDCTTEEELYYAVLEAYDGDKDALYENATLLYLLRHEGDSWTDPITRKANAKEAKSSTD